MLLTRSEFTGLASVWLVFFGMIVSLHFIKPFLGLYVLETGGDTLLVGAVFAANPLASFAIRVPGAALANRYGTRTMILIGLLINGLAILFYTTSANPVILISGSLLQGLGFGLFHPSMLAKMTQVRVGRLRGEESVAYISTSVAAGQTLGPALGSLLIIGGFQTLFFGAALISFASIPLALAIMKKEEPAIGKLGITGSFRRLLTKDFGLLLFSRTAFSYPQGAIMAFIPIFMADAFKVSKSEVGLLFTVMAICNFAARPIGGQLIRRLGEGFLLKVGTALMGLSALTYAWSFHPSLPWVAAVFYGTALGIFVPPALVYVGKAFSTETRTLGMAFYTIMIDMGLSLGGALSAGILERTDYFTMFTVASGVGFSGMAAASVGVQRTGRTTGVLSDRSNASGSPS